MIEIKSTLSISLYSLFAQGVNHIIWHGKPFSTEKQPNDFYATIHVGPDSPFADKIPDFNQYLTSISEYMKLGKTYASCGVYLPQEDMIASGTLPQKLHKPSALYYWELQYLRYPEFLAGYNPIWISPYFLDQADVVDGKIVVADTVLDFLYLGPNYLDYENIIRLYDLVKHGATLIFTSRPKEIGRNKHSDFSRLLNAVKDNKSTYPNMAGLSAFKPLVAADKPVSFWARENASGLYVFFCHPAAIGLRFPLRYGQCYETNPEHREISIMYNGLPRIASLDFPPLGSKLLFCPRTGPCRLIEIDTRFQYDTP